MWMEQEGWKEETKQTKEVGLPPDVGTYTQMVLRSHRKGAKVRRLGLTLAFREDSASRGVKNGWGQG